MPWSRKWAVAGLGVLLVLLMWGGATRPLFSAADEPLFVPANADAHVDMPHSGALRTTGQAWGDFDNDGDLDLYLTDPAAPNRLYENLGDGTFRLSPLSEQVALPNQRSTGAIFADYDNDGWPDLYVLARGRNALLHNDGGRAFYDVTLLAGVGDEADGQSATWGDFDNDGDLDLYVVNWSCSPDCGRPQSGDRDRLYRNNGDGTFDDVTHWLGSKTTGAGFAATFFDYDNDGDLDLYVVNDEFIAPTGNVLWRNDGAGCGGWCFTDVSAETGADVRLMGMGLAVGDYDNDGDLDLYFTNAGPMVLLQNLTAQGEPRFVNVAPQAGVEHAEGIGWGAVFVDCDNDGWLDLYVAESDVKGDGLPANPLYHNNGDGTFTMLPPTDAGASDAGRSTGVAYADYNGDGWTDLVVGNFGRGYTLYRNTRHAPHHWLRVRLVGGGPVNRDAVGAKVLLTTPDGVRQTRVVHAGSSLGAGHELALTFGLGVHTTADVRIIWPDGTEQTLANVRGDRAYTIAYPLTWRERLALTWALWRVRLALGAAGALLTLGGVGMVLWRWRKREHVEQAP